MKVKFITCIYGNLFGTELGGRPSRGGHYLFSLMSLAKMTDADFLCYTSAEEIDHIKHHFFVENNFSPEKIKFEVFDIKNVKSQSLIDQYNVVEETKKSDRCVPIQYSKIHWWWNEDKSYDYYYWIDAGLSHSGLIPAKYLTLDGSYRGYFESSLFNNKFLENLIKFTDDKFFLIGKENLRNYWSGTVDHKWYKQHDMSLHIIGGLFGGKKEVWDDFANEFEDYIYKITQDSGRLYFEENIFSLMYFNAKEKYNIKEFDTWWCLGNAPQGIEDDYFNHNKSFYKILEELNE
jgi:hypothetical protein